MTRRDQTDPAWLETGRDEMFREYGFVRPDVEQVSEGLRVPPHRVRAYHDAAAADRARRFWDAVWLIVTFPNNAEIQGRAFLIGWAVSALTLIFLSCGLKTPVTHHMTIIAALAAVIMMRIQLQGGGSIGAATPTQMVIAVLFGAVFGAISGLVGELLSRLMNARGDTHIDPPAAAIWSSTLLVLVLSGN